MITVKPNALVSFTYLKSEYDPNEGTVEKWIPIEFMLTEDEPLRAFPAQWMNAFGAELIAAQGLNVKQLATVRMGFNPDVYEQLQTAQVRVYKNGSDVIFSLYGSVDNVSEGNQVLEFKVQRWEEK